jgi:hypothetical protein
MKLTRELDSERGKDNLIQELQDNLQTFDKTIDNQNEQISELRIALQGPLKVQAMT